MSAGDVLSQPRSPQEFGWLIDKFTGSTPGVTHALIVSSDGLALLASTGMVSDLVDPLAAMVSGIISLGNSIAAQVGDRGCDQVMLKLTHGHVLFMSIGALAGLAVVVDDTAQLGLVAARMAQLVERAGHALTPQMRDDLRRQSAQRHSAYAGPLAGERR